MCGANALCLNLPGNYTCECPEGFYGNPHDGCVDIDECSQQPDACGPGAICTNVEGGHRCDCPAGYEGDARSASGCIDYDECVRSPCGRNAECLNTDGSFRCLCPHGYAGDPSHNCEGMSFIKLLAGSIQFRGKPLPCSLLFSMLRINHTILF